MTRVTTSCSLFAAVAATLLAASPAAAGDCRDPWITQAIREVTGRAPNGSGESGECTYTQYRGGSWSSYAELKAAVQAKFSPAGYAFGQPQQFAPPAQVRARVDQVQTRDMGGGKMQFYANGKWYWLVGNDGASLIGNDSGGFISTNGGTFISTNGATILSNANAALRRGY
jgi:hypothetical protein